MSENLRTVQPQDLSEENPIDGDLQLFEGQFVFVDEAEAIAQHVEQRLRFFQGEWVLDTRLGFPWFQRFLGQRQSGITQRLLESFVRKTILGTPGVTSITAFAVVWDAALRTYSITYEARTIAGSTGPREALLILGGQTT
jgi:hypothetical protein